MFIKILRIAFAITGAIIIVDCVALMAVGKVNFGSVVPCAIGVVFITHSLYWHRIRRIVSQRPMLNRVWYGLWGLFGVWLLSFGVFIGLLQQQIHRSSQPVPEVAAVIVLGSGTVDGQPTPTLAQRLDAAVPIIQAQSNALVITSGGVGFGRERSEANIMATYLTETHGIAFTRILQEGNSTSTEENLSHSEVILQTNGISIAEPIAIVTSDFHTVRAAAIARHQGYKQPITVASSTPLSIRYNAWFREYFAFVSGWILGEY